MYASHGNMYDSCLLKTADDKQLHKSRWLVLQLLLVKWIPWRVRTNFGDPLFTSQVEPLWRKINVSITWNKIHPLTKKTSLVPAGPWKLLKWCNELRIHSVIGKQRYKMQTSFTKRFLNLIVIHYFLKMDHCKNRQKFILCIWYNNSCRFKFI